MLNGFVAEEFNLLRHLNHALGREMISTDEF
jgi:hypothetical protein